MFLSMYRCIYQYFEWCTRRYRNVYITSTHHCWCVGPCICTHTHTAGVASIYIPINRQYIDICTSMLSGSPQEPHSVGVGLLSFFSFFLFHHKSRTLFALASFLFVSFFLFHHKSHTLFTLPPFIFSLFFFASPQEPHSVYVASFLPLFQGP